MRTEGLLSPGIPEGALEAHQLAWLGEGFSPSTQAGLWETMEC